MFDNPPITSPVIEMLRVGRALIETRGLARGVHQDRDGRVCAVGGITRQKHKEADQDRLSHTIGAALRYLAMALPVNIGGIAAWNDDHTAADVLAVYDRAIDLATADLLAGS